MKNMDFVFESIPEEPKIRFGHNTTKNWSMSSAHFHNYYELNLSISGGNRFFVNDVIHEAKSGDLFFFNDTDLHKNFVPKDFEYERYIILFDPHEVAGLFPEGDLMYLYTDSMKHLKNKLSLTCEQIIEVTLLLEDVLHHVNGDYEGNTVYIKLKLCELLLFLTTVCKSRSKSETVVKRTSAKIHPILQYINRNIGSELSIKSLSEHFYINKSYLCELFRKETGLTLNQYITSKRLLLSKELLKQGKTVIEVTGLVGYKNDAYFIRLFKKYFGFTPKKFAMRQ